MSNNDGIRDLRAAIDAGEAVRIANGLREELLALVGRGEMTPQHYMVACASGLDEIRERAGIDPKVHDRRAERLRNALVIGNKGLVWSVTKRTLGAAFGNEANREEALQEGNIGLVRAIDTFDENRGAFSTCAALWIRHHVQSCAQKQVDFRKQRSACMPAAVARAVARFRALRGREPEAFEVGATEEDWTKWAEQMHVTSVEDMISGEINQTSDEVIPDSKSLPDDSVANVHLTDRLAAELAAMSPRNREIAQALFVEGESLTDVAARFSVDHSRIFQLKRVLEKRLRKVLAA